MKSSDRILILGSGAMACLFAAKLSQARFSIQMLGRWEEGLKAIAEKGVLLESPDGQRQSFEVQAFSSPSAIKPVSLALVLVKSWQTVRAAEDLKTCLSPDGFALTLQNGLGNLEILSESLSPQRALIGSTTAGATLLEAGVVRPAGKGKVVVGKHKGAASFLEIMRLAGFDIESAENIQTLIWGKLVINCAINPLTAILEVMNGELLTLEPAYKLMETAAREAGQVASMLEITLPYPDPGAAAAQVAQDTAQNYSSMLQDIQRSAPTEIDAISGAVANAAHQLGMDAPINRALWRLVKAKVEIRRGTVGGSVNRKIGKRNQLSEIKSAGST